MRHVEGKFASNINVYNMRQIHCYTWLVDTIRRKGEISHQDLSRLWKNETKLSGNKPLNRSTFRRWRKKIQAQFGLTIDCHRSGVYSYYIKNPEDFDACPHLYDLFNECINRITPKDVVDDNIVRRDVVDCMFYLQKGLSSCDNDNIWFSHLVSSMLSLKMRFMSKAEGEYILSCLKKWFREGFEPVAECIADLALMDLTTADMSKRKLGFDEKELVRIISDYNGRAYLFLKRLLGNVVVRKLFFRKANEGDSNYAFHLADYLYQKRRYKRAFDYLIKIEYGNYDSAVSEFLGLMYFYGRGVVRDYNKAREYLERYTPYSDPELTYALGEAYMVAGNFYKATKLYREFLIQPYGDVMSPYYVKIKRRFTEIRSTFGIPDWVNMTVKIGRSNRRCEFSVELPAFCRVSLCWGEPRASVYLYQSGEERTKMTFRHTYRCPGEYQIHFEGRCLHSIEALEFSKYKNQLKSIQFLTGRGLKKLSIIGQQLETLLIPPSEYLTGLICRSNNINSLNLSECPRLIHLDCSNNPVSVLKLHRNSPLTKACVKNTQIDREVLSKILRSNRGTFCNALDYNSLKNIDMRLEYYFRCTSWSKTRKYLRTKLNYYYSHALTECELAFYKLKEMARKNNRSPYKKR